LDSYASSVHTAPETLNANGDESLAEQTVAASPTSTSTPRSHARSNSNSNSLSASPPASSSLPYGPYFKSGRGGAGNFTWQSEILPDSDVEVQNVQQRQSSLSERQKAAALAEHLEINEAVQAKSLRRKKPEYLNVGIGGAGNMAITQSNEVQSPRSPSFSRSSFGSGGPGSSQLSAGGHGRGGAGNFAAVAEVEKAALNGKDEEERMKAEKTRQKIEAEVDGLLKMPEGALVVQGRSRDV